MLGNKDKWDQLKNIKTQIILLQLLHGMVEAIKDCLVISLTLIALVTSLTNLPFIIVPHHVLQQRLVQYHLLHGLIVFIRHQFFAFIVLLTFIHEPRHVGSTFLQLTHHGIVPGKVSTFVPYRIFLGNLPSHNLGLNVSIIYRSIDLRYAVHDINRSLLIIIFGCVIDSTIFVSSITALAFIRESGASIWVIIVHADIVIDRRNGVQYPSKILVVRYLSSIHRSWRRSGTWSHLPRVLPLAFYC